MSAPLTDLHASSTVIAVSHICVSLPVSTLSMALKFELFPREDSSGDRRKFG